MEPTIIIAVVGSMTLLFTAYSWIKNQKIANARDAKKVIVELINEINENKVLMTFMNYGPNQNGLGYGGARMNVEFTLFEFSDLEKYPGYEPFKDYQVFFARGSNQILDIKKYLDNPLLPQEVKSSLDTFYCKKYTKLRKSRFIKKVDFAHIKTSYFIEGFTISKLNDVDFKLGDAIPFQSFYSFRISCENLEQSINKWSSLNNMQIQTRFQKV